ncbi:aldehyde dehydrogenase [Coniochaeta sp. PMI_546]|nr:aldehyde dehydrogenase [Coniochaeta sp. PMI_546]
MSDMAISLKIPNGKEITLSTGLFINNEFVKGSSEEKLTSIDPATEQPICSVEVAAGPDVDAAVQAARAAFNDPAWRDLTPEDRSKLLHKAADLVEEHLDELFAIQSLDVGKPYASSRDGEGAHLVGTLRYFAGWADKVLGQTIPVSKDKFAYTLKQPVGVCGAISPWNYPLTNSGWKLGPALATGNCIILKPSEYSPLAALYLAELFKKAGYPPGVVQVLNGYGKETGELLTTHLGIDKIAFTGSTATGRRIIKAASVNMKKTTIEAGGKSAFIVFDDADLEQAAKWAAFGGFGNSGQICSANSRILVQEGAEEKFLEIFSRIARDTKVGHPFDEATLQGPQASKMQYDKILGYIEGAKAEGAKVVVGGGPLKGAAGKGYFIEPTIFSGVTSDMKIFQEEVFGPVLAVTTFKTEEEAVTLANNSSFGLAAMIFTENLKIAHRTAAKLQTGMVWINESNNTDYKIAFGGFKQSGLGRELGASALEAYLEEKVVHVNLGLKL